MWPTENVGIEPETAVTTSTYRRKPHHIIWILYLCVESMEYGVLCGLRFAAFECDSLSLHGRAGLAHCVHTVLAHTRAPIYRIEAILEQSQSLGVFFTQLRESAESYPDKRMAGKLHAEGIFLIPSAACLCCFIRVCLLSVLTSIPHSRTSIW